MDRYLAVAERDEDIAPRCSRAFEQKVGTAYNNKYRFGVERESNNWINPVRYFFPSLSASKNICNARK